MCVCVWPWLIDIASNSIPTADEYINSNQIYQSGLRYNSQALWLKPCHLFIILKISLSIHIPYSFAYPIDDYNACACVCVSVCTNMFLFLVLLLIPHTFHIKFILTWYIDICYIPSFFFWLPRSSSHIWKSSTEINPFVGEIWCYLFQSNLSFESFTKLETTNIAKNELSSRKWNVVCFWFIFIFYSSENMTFG